MAYFNNCYNEVQFDSSYQPDRYMFTSAYSSSQPRSTYAGTISPQDLHQNDVANSYSTMNYITAVNVRPYFHRASRSSSDGRNYSSADSSPTDRSCQPVVVDTRSPNSRYIETSGNYVSIEPRIEVVRTDTKSKERYYCDLPNCVDETGRPRSVGRKADLKRHMKTVHGKPTIDCEYRKCWRKGEDGFCRDDHYREHLRGYHNETRR